jgi:protease secretion system membrane fusion protein
VGWQVREPKKLKGKMLQSGMPTQVIIKTGERSLFAYLIHPFIKRISASLKEE